MVIGLGCSHVEIITKQNHFLVFFSTINKPCKERQRFSKAAVSCSRQILQTDSVIKKKVYEKTYLENNCNGNTSIRKRN